MAGCGNRDQDVSQRDGAVLARNETGHTLRKVERHRFIGLSDRLRDPLVLPAHAALVLMDGEYDEIGGMLVQKVE